MRRRGDQKEAVGILSHTGCRTTKIAPHDPHKETSKEGAVNRGRAGGNRALEGQRGGQRGWVLKLLEHLGHLPRGWCRWMGASRMGRAWDGAVGLTVHRVTRARGWSGSVGRWGGWGSEVCVCV